MCPVSRNYADWCNAGCSLGKTAILKAFKDASHTGILTDERLVDEVIQIVKGSKSGAWTDLGLKLHNSWGRLQQYMGAGIFKGMSWMI